MTRDTVLPSVMFRLAILALAWFVLQPGTPVMAQASDTAEGAGEELVDDVGFRTETWRVDLYRNDAGETVERLVEVDEGIAGDEIEYRIIASNDGDRIYRPRQFAASVEIPDGVTYIEGSADADAEDVVVEFSADGGDTFSEPPVSADGATVAPEDYDAIQWIHQERFEPGDEITFSYRVAVE